MGNTSTNTTAAAGSASVEVTFKGMKFTGITCGVLGNTTTRTELASALAGKWTDATSVVCTVANCARRRLSEGKRQLSTEITADLTATFTVPTAKQSAMETAVLAANFAS